MESPLTAFMVDSGTLLRVAIFTVAVINMGAMLAISLTYWRAYRMLVTASGPPAGILPAYVWVMTVSVGGIQGSLAWSQSEALVQDVAIHSVTTWVRLALYFAFSLLLTFALVLASGRHRRVEVTKARPTPTVPGGIAVVEVTRAELHED